MNNRTVELLTLFFNLIYGQLVSITSHTYRRRMPCIREGDVEEHLCDVLLSFSNIAALIAGTLLLDWGENLIKRDIFLPCVFLY